jgi:hypothetical protein
MKSQKTHGTEKQNRTYPTAAILIVITTIILATNALAQPTGVDISGNITETAGSVPPADRTDEGGTITTMILDVLQQNPRWKAYVGNPTGVLTLDDASGQSIFRWELGAETLTGEVYISRSDAVSWGDIACSNQTLIDDEDVFLGFSGTSADSVNRTFNETTHPTITVGTTPLDNCRSTSTYVNSTAQPQGSADFPLVLIQDTSNLVYATPINQGSDSYNTGTQAEFQAIVPDQVGDTTTYYFYAEIGS